MFLQLMQLAQCHRQCWKRSIDVSQVGGEHTEQIRFCMSWAVCSRVLISVFHFCALINISWMKMAGAKAEDLSARPICKVNFCAIRCLQNQCCSVFTTHCRAGPLHLPSKPLVHILKATFLYYKSSEPNGCCAVLQHRLLAIFPTLWSIPC